MARRVLPLAAPLALTALFVVLQTAFVLRDVGPQFTDAQFVHALQFHRAWSAGADAPEVPFPPVIYAVAHAAFAIGGPTMTAARLGLLPFGALLVFAMFGVGRRLGGGVWSGVAVMALAAASPHALVLSRTYLPDFPQAATSALVLWALLASDGFRRPWVALGIGAALALTMLTKWSAAFFVALPVVWTVLPAAVRSGRAAALAGVGALGFGGIGLALVGQLPRAGADGAWPWWLAWGLSAALPAAALAGLGVWARGRALHGAGPARGVARDGGGAPGDGAEAAARTGWRGVPAVAHALWAGALFVAVTTPWYLRHGALVWGKLTHDTGFVRDLGDNAGFLGAMLGTSHTAAPLLALGGLAALALGRPGRWALGGQLAALAASAAWLLWLGLPEPRYFVSLTLFTAALCGGWVSAVGRARHAIGGAVLLAAVLSMAAWTVVPGTARFYAPVDVALHGTTWVPAKVLCTMPPDERRFDLDGVLDAVIGEAGPHRPVALVFADAWGRGPRGGLPFDYRFVQAALLARGAERPMTQVDDAGQLRAELARAAGGGRSGGRRADAMRTDTGLSRPGELVFVVVHPAQRTPRATLDALAGAVAPTALAIREVEIGEGFRAAVAWADDAGGGAAGE